MASTHEQVRSAAARFFGTSRRSGSLAIPARFMSAGFAMSDFTTITLCAWLAGLAYHWQTFSRLASEDAYVATGAVFASLFVLRMHARGYYSMERLTARPVDLTEIVSTWLMVVGICTGLAFMLKVGGEVSRGFFLVFVAGGVATICCLRAGTQRIARHAVTAHVIADRRVLLLGERSEVFSFGLQRRLRASGYRIVDAIPCEFRSNADIATCAASAISRARSEPVEEILICLSWSRFDDLEDLLKRLRVLPLPALVVADHRVRNLLSKPVTQVGSVLALEVQRSPLSLGEQAAKRAFDVVVAAVALLALAPLLAGVAVAIRLGSPGPALFRQTRIGFSGRRFQIYKFRTMTVQDDGAVVRQATRDDRRVTRLGRFLRRSSIDELPQLLNVLRGEMSLVGPRPHALAHDDQYTQMIANYAYRHHMKPGITGLAQTNKCRGETQTVDKMEQRVGYDIQYINSWSIWLDLKLIFATATQVFKHDAY